MEEQAKSLRQSKRRRQILGATLRLLRRHGTGISTAQIAAEAHCSKETLYSWFKDREGIFRALIEEQAGSMGDTFRRSSNRGQGTFGEKLIVYCVALLDILTGEAAIAVNRVAMAQACKERADLGLVVLDDWHTRVAVPFMELFDQGELEGLIDLGDPEEAFEILVGLLVGDRQRRLLLGEDGRPNVDEMEIIASKTVERWLKLYAVQ